MRSTRAELPRAMWKVASQELGFLAQSKPLWYSLWMFNGGRENWSQRVVEVEMPGTGQERPCTVAARPITCCARLDQHRISNHPLCWAHHLLRPSFADRPSTTVVSSLMRLNIQRQTPRRGPAQHTERQRGVQRSYAESLEAPHSRWLTYRLPLDAWLRCSSARG